MIPAHDREAGERPLVLGRFEERLEPREIVRRKVEGRAIGVLAGERPRRPDGHLRFFLGAVEDAACLGAAMGDGVKSLSNVGVNLVQDRGGALNRERHLGCLARLRLFQVHIHSYRPAEPKLQGPVSSYCLLRRGFGA